MNRRLFLARVGMASFATPLLAAKAEKVSVPKVAPRPEDIATIDGIVRAFYEVISGPAGEPREWSRDRTLYVDGVRFVALEETGGKTVAHVYDHQAFADETNSLFVTQGFFESEIHRTTSTFGHLVHAMSTYESRRKADGPVIGRGINSLQLFWDGKRWFIASAVWND